MKFDLDKAIYFILGLVVGMAITLFIFVLVKPVGATTQEWKDTSSCEPLACGTYEGLKTQEKVSYKDPICPDWYYVKNSGNWNQRCHRVFNWQQPEHKAPLGCPQGYTQDGANCVLVETREIACEVEEEDYYACVIDQCDNLEGVQESVPEGYTQEKTEEGWVCNEVLPVPTPEPQPVSHDGPVAAPAEPICKDLGGYAPTITGVYRVDRDTVRAEYTSPSENTDKYLIWYGLSADNLVWNTITKEQYVELSGEELVGKHVWLNVRAMSEGCTGVASVTTDP